MFKSTFMGVEFLNVLRNVFVEFFIWRTYATQSHEISTINRKAEMKEVIGIRLTEEKPVATHPFRRQAFKHVIVTLFGYFLKGLVYKLLAMAIEKFIDFFRRYSNEIGIILTHFQFLKGFPSIVRMNIIGHGGYDIAFELAGINNVFHTALLICSTVRGMMRDAE